MAVTKKSSGRQKLREIVRTVKKLVRAVSARFERTHMTVYAAQASYYMLFSVIPILMLFCMAAKELLPGQFEQIFSKLQGALPALLGDLPEVFWETILSASVPSLSIAIVSVLWAASKGMRAVSSGLCAVYGVRPARNFLMKYLLSILYTMVLIAILLFSLVLLVFGSQIGRMLEHWIPSISALFSLLLRLRGIISISVFSLIFTLMYKWMAARHWRFRRLFPGAVFAGAGWILFSQFFSLYLQYFSKYTTLYGALGVLMILMLWINGCMLLFLLGAELNVFLDSSRVI